MKELSLFSGIGGGLLGSYLLGWHPVAAVDFEPYCCEVLARRKADGIFKDPFDIFCMDVSEFNKRVASIYRGKVDIITAGFPCQPFSIAGKQMGENDPRNGWPATIDAIRRIRPRYLLLENVPGLLRFPYFRQVILRELTEAFYEYRVYPISAAEVGAPHKRDRLWIVGNAKSSGEYDSKFRGPNIADASTISRGKEKLANSSIERCGETGGFCREHPDGITKRGEISDTDNSGSGTPRNGIDRDRQEEIKGREKQSQHGTCGQSEMENSHSDRAKRDESQHRERRGIVETSKDVSDLTEAGLEGEITEGESREHDRLFTQCNWWDIDPANLDRESESYVGRLVDGIPNRVDRVKAIGNGQVPEVVRVAFNLLSEVINEK